MTTNDDDAMSNAPSQNDLNWPPKSPHQALISSPSGRRKWQQRCRNQLSPGMGSPRTRPHVSPLLSDGVESGQDDEDGDDEETLQLRLQVIEVRLRLKKLQAAKAKQVDSAVEGSEKRDIFRPRARNTPAGRGQPQAADCIKAQSEVQVPLSPSTDRRASLNPTSPARVKLGIDKGLRARDVSLKRPVMFCDTSNASSHLGSNVLSASSSGPSGTASRDLGFERPKSFSERLAESRLKGDAKHEKERRIKKMRSQGFALDAVDRLGCSPDDRPLQLSNRSKSRTSETPAHPGFPRHSSGINTSLDLSTADTPTVPGNTSSPSKLPEFNADRSASFEPFAGIHLSRRMLGHNILARALDQKELYPLPRLLATVKGPDYEPPDHEADYVVLGIVASKSTPRDIKNNKTTATADPADDDGPNKSKFMVLHLTDFKWEVDLFLFGTAFTTFWKLTPGTLIAILNPGVFPPRDKRTGQFSLKLGSSEDTILEIGAARDLGFCKSVRKDGQECGSWVDKRKTEFCEYHIHLQTERCKRGRMEVNTMTGFGKGLSGRNGARPAENGKRYDSYLHETMYILPKHITSKDAARRLDHDEYGITRSMTRKELHQKRLAEKEREREIAGKLGRIGGKAGGEYMKAKAGSQPGKSFTEGSSRPGGHNIAVTAVNSYDTPFTHSQDAPRSVDAASLGLLGKRACDVSISPVKRKRTMTLANKSQTSKPIGWSGAGTRGLLLNPPNKLTSTRRTDDTLCRDGQPDPQLSPHDMLSHPEQSRTKKGSPTKKARQVIEENSISRPGLEIMRRAAMSTKASSSDDDELEII